MRFLKNDLFSFFQYPLMKQLSLDTHPPRLQGESCARNQTQRSRCEVYVQACPIDAITLYQGKVHFDSAASVTCGACQFVCPIDKPNRHWLQIGNNKSSLSRVTPGWQMRRMFFADVSEYQLILDQTKCFLCGACTRFCLESAISLDNETMILNHTRCNGCGGCEDIYFSHAIQVTKNHEHTLTVLAVNERSCSTCLRSFMVWSVKSKQCPVCQRHHYGMREA